MDPVSSDPSEWTLIQTALPVVVQGKKLVDINKAGLDLEKSSSAVFRTPTGAVSRQAVLSFSCILGEEEKKAGMLLARRSFCVAARACGILACLALLQRRRSWRRPRRTQKAKGSLKPAEGAIVGQPPGQVSCPHCSHRLHGQGHLGG